MARGCILKRRNKNGTVTYSIKYRTADGTQVKRAAGRSRREAEQALTTAQSLVDRGMMRTTSRETVADAAERWLGRKRPALELSTYRDYEAHLRLRLLPALGNRRVRQLTRGHIEDYLAALDSEGRLSRKTINDSLIPLRQILGRAVLDGVLAVNPAASHDRDSPLELPYERPTMLYLTRYESLQYLSGCPPWYRPLAEVLLGAGLRIGEAIALEWPDVDWDAAAINVTRAVKLGGTGTPKGDRGRAVAVDSFVLSALRDHRELSEARKGPPLVFRSPHGSTLDRHNVRRRGHDAALRSAGLDLGLRLHDLRHTAATLWLAAGESIYFVQQQLGHKDIQTTIDLYGHPDQAAHRRAAERAAEWWRHGPREGVQVPRPVPQLPSVSTEQRLRPVTTGPGVSQTGR